MMPRLGLRAAAVPPMSMLLPSLSLLLLLLLLSGINAGANTTAATTTILLPAAPQPLEALAARELRRYLFVRTGRLARIIGQSTEDDASAGSLCSAARTDEVLVLGNGEAVRTLLAAAPCSTAAVVADALRHSQPDNHIVKTVHRQASGHHVVALAGASPKAVLYAAYSFAELALGVRFLLHGDVLPPRDEAFVLPLLSHSLSPAFSLRGLQPFHDFTAGPDWWSADDHKVIMIQLTKMRMNFVGFHSYPYPGSKKQPHTDLTVQVRMRRAPLRLSRACLGNSSIWNSHPQNGFLTGPSGAARLGGRSEARRHQRQRGGRRRVCDELANNERHGLVYATAQHLELCRGCCPSLSVRLLQQPRASGSQLWCSVRFG
jgi:hypothetical protein